MPVPEADQVVAAVDQQHCQRNQVSSDGLSHIELVEWHARMSMLSKNEWKEYSPKHSVDHEFHTEEIHVEEVKPFPNSKIRCRVDGSHEYAFCCSHKEIDKARSEAPVGEICEISK